MAGPLDALRDREELEEFYQRFVNPQTARRRGYGAFGFSGNYALTGAAPGNDFRGGKPIGGARGNDPDKERRYMAFAKKKKKDDEKRKRNEVLAELRRMGLDDDAKNLMREELVGQFRNVGKPTSRGVTKVVSVQKKNPQEDAMQDAIRNNKQLMSLQKELSSMGKFDLTGTRARALTKQLSELSGGAVSDDPRVAKKFFDTQKAQENQERKNAEFARKEAAAEELRAISREYQNPAIDAEIAKHMKMLNQPGVNAEDVIRSAKGAAFRAFKTEERKYNEQDKKREFSEQQQQRAFGQQDKMFEKRIGAAKEAFDAATDVRREMAQQKQVFNRVARNEQSDAQMQQAIAKNEMRANAVIAGINAQLKNLDVEVTRGSDGSLIVDAQKRSTNQEVQNQIRALQVEAARVAEERDELKAGYERWRMGQQQAAPAAQEANGRWMPELGRYLTAEEEADFQSNGY
jgi:hypothetical protein